MPGRQTGIRTELPIVCLHGAFTVHARICINSVRQILMQCSGVTIIIRHGVTLVSVNDLPPPVVDCKLQSVVGAPGDVCQLVPQHR